MDYLVSATRPASRAAGCLFPFLDLYPYLYLYLDPVLGLGHRMRSLLVRV